MLLSSYKEDIKQDPSEALTILTFVVIFAVTALKLEIVGPMFSIFNPCPSLPSVETNDKK